MKITLTLLIFLHFAALSSKAQSSVDTVSAKKHLEYIIQTPGFRNYQNVTALNRVADYIKSEFAKYAVQVFEQAFVVEGITYRNIICSFDTSHDERIIIGAHYDVCGAQDGADDNASGTVGLLELAKLLQGKKLSYRIDLVAYTLEEPPYFKTENMGSFVHAKYLHDNKIKVRGMVSLEMIGFFSDRKKSQRYPAGILKLFYGNKGNFITVVQKFHNSKFPNRFKRKMKRQGLVRTKSFKAPPSLPGIDWSDHLNYWKFGFSACMITDTSFYRNHNYHLPSDKLETLDLKRMCRVIESVYQTLLIL